MGIVDEDIARVRAASDFLQIAGEHIALRRVGRRYQGLCPFHAEKTASFSVNAEEGLFYCFGCQAKGDVITFLREVEHLDFAEAVERLAARAGIELRYDNQSHSGDRKRRTRLVDALARAVDWYHQRLLGAADGASARAYLRSRGYDGEVVRSYRLGWAPEGWDVLASALRLPDDVLRDTGLGFVNRRRRQQDHLRARIVFPIFDVHGDPVAFGGRALPGSSEPKYKNSPETPLYTKSKVLYGLNWAKADVVRAGEVVVCEGYTDVIGFAQAGIPRAVATCGTALAEDHFRALKNFARRIVLAYDADAAGQAAAERVYEWEQRHEVDVTVASLPRGSDPADLARSRPEALRASVESAKPFLAFRLERALRAVDLGSAEGRARGAEAALAVIAEHPSELVRDQYVMQVADRCRIGPEQLRAHLRRGVAPPARTDGAPSRPAGPRRSRGGPELEGLRLAVHRPAEVAGRLHEVLFDDEGHLAAFRALESSTTIHEAIAHADPATAALLQRVAVEDSEADADDVVARLAREAGQRALAEIETAGREAAEPFEYMRANAPLVEWLKLTIEKLNDPGLGTQAGGVLVAWLVDRLQVEA